MFNLQKYEKAILLFLILTLVLGLAVMAYQKSHPGVKVNIGSYSLDSETDRSSGNLLTEGRRVNINAAGADELEKIRGVGKVLAGRIVAYRTSNGPFISVEDIKKVRGIGQAMFEKIKARITVE